MTGEKLPKMDAIKELLKDLTEAHGVPGYEAPIRAVVRKYMDHLGENSQDKIGINKGLTE